MRSFALLALIIGAASGLLVSSSTALARSAPRAAAPVALFAKKEAVAKKGRAAKKVAKKTTRLQAAPAPGTIRVGGLGGIAALAVAPGGAAFIVGAILISGIAKPPDQLPFKFLDGFYQPAIEKKAKQQAALAKIDAAAKAAKAKEVGAAKAAKEAEEAKAKAEAEAKAKAEASKAAPAAKAKPAAPAPAAPAPAPAPVPAPAPAAPAPAAKTEAAPPAPAAKGPRKVKPAGKCSANKGGPGLPTGCKQAFGGPKRTNADVTKQYESVRAKVEKDIGKTPKFAKSPDSPAMVKSAENQKARDAAKAEYKAAMEAKYQAAKAEEVAKKAAALEKKQARQAAKVAVAN